MIAIKILITQPYLLWLPSCINNQLRRRPSQTPSLLLLLRKIIVCYSFTFNDSRKRMQEMESFVGSMCVCMHLSIWVVLTLLFDVFYLKWRTKAIEKDGKRVWCEWWNNDLHIQLMYKQRAWLEDFPELFQLQGYVLWMFTVFFLWPKTTLFFPLKKKKLLNCFVYPFISEKKHEGLCASR